MVAIRTAFDRQLRMLDTDVLRLAELVETQLTEAVQALREQNTERAQRVYDFDASINQLRYDIEEQAYELLALQHPNAGDMRRIVAAVSIATNLERMGDHAAGIARLALRLAGLEPRIYVPELDEMARLASEQLQAAMAALSAQDAPLARSVVPQDEQIDRLHKRVYDRLITAMIEDSGLIEHATMLLWVSHNIERFADRISNICERIVYVVTGNLHEQWPDPMP